MVQQLIQHTVQPQIINNTGRQEKKKPLGAAGVFSFFVAYRFLIRQIVLKSWIYGQS